MLMKQTSTTKTSATSKDDAPALTQADLDGDTRPSSTTHCGVPLKVRISFRICVTRFARSWLSMRLPGREENHHGNPLSMQCHADEISLGQVVSSSSRFTLPNIPVTPIRHYRAAQIEHRCARRAQHHNAVVIFFGTNTFTGGLHVRLATPAFPAKTRVNLVQSRRKDANIVVSRENFTESCQHQVCLSAPPLIRSGGDRLSRRTQRRAIHEVPARQPHPDSLSA